MDSLALADRQRGLEWPSPAGSRLESAAHLASWRWETKARLKSGHLAFGDALGLLILQTELAVVVAGLAALAPQYDLQHAEAAELARSICAPFDPRATLAMLEPPDHHVLRSRWLCLASPLSQ